MAVVTAPINSFISIYNYQPDTGKHVAVVDGNTLYYFDNTTVHPTQFHYSHKKHYTDYSEYYLVGNDGKTYVLFTLTAVYILLPQLTIPNPVSVITPVQNTITLIYQHGVITTHPVSKRAPIVQVHELKIEPLCER